MLRNFLLIIALFFCLIIFSGVNLANFANGPYWSSTEYDSGRAWKKLFNGSGPNYQNHKFIADNIRAVRAF